MKIRKREFGDGVSSFFEQLMEPHRVTPRFWKVPEVTITTIGGITAVITFGVFLLLYVMAHFLIPIWGWIALAVWVILHVFLSGEMGVRFRLWLNLEPVILRRPDVVLDPTPISRASTRILCYGLFAVELAFWVWFPILKLRPALYLDWVQEIYFRKPVLYAYDQLYFYWWLLPVLGLAFACGLKGLEYLPGTRVLLRKTRLVNLVSFLLGLYLIGNFLIWWDQVHPTTFGG